MKNLATYDLGLATLEKFHGDHVGAAMVESMKDIAPDFADIVIDTGFGRVVSRPGLEPKIRALVTIASCTTLGHAAPQLRAHIESALKLGASRQEIIEVILQISFYAGFPAATNAFTIVKEVFQAEDNQYEIMQPNA